MDALVDNNVINNEINSACDGGRIDNEIDSASDGGRIEKDMDSYGTLSDEDLLNNEEEFLERLRLQSLNDKTESNLFQRRRHHQEGDHDPNDVQGGVKPFSNPSTNMSLANGVCHRCNEGFNSQEQIVNSNGEIWHTQCFVNRTCDLPCTKCGLNVCDKDSMISFGGRVWHPHCFVCAQCFQPFQDGVFYEFDGRKYCEHDFHMLFAPCCGKCREFIIGRVIKAMNSNWHPDCFRCELCTAPLSDCGFVKNAGRALCKECNNKERAKGMGKYVCHKCHAIIEEGHIKFKGEAYHPYHFNCTSCGVELDANGREKGGELYCLRCHDKMGIPICGACRRPIEERVVHALGKAWHVEHFVCAKCERPFFGTRHYEKKGLAYCETHYHQLFGNICFVCNNVVQGDVFSAFNKAWCVSHFCCSICDRKMSQKTKFFEFDLKPVCRVCHEKFPGELKKRLKKYHDDLAKKGQTT